MSYNLRNRRCIILLPVLFFSTGIYTAAQDSSYTRPAVTDKWDVYKTQVSRDPYKKMVELRSLAPTIVYDLKYAGIHNFMRRLMYPAGTNTAYLRTGAAHALKKVQEDLEKKGLGLKVYDAYRPYSVTVKFWELVKDTRYVAHPAKGSGHNRGTTIDLTLVNLATGKELDMGTGFDNFSDTAHHGFSHLPETVRQNRQLLKSTMERFGFTAYQEEWWHYGYSDGKSYELLDIEFKKLKKNL